MAYDHMPWNWLLLVILDTGKPVRLQDIYSELEEWFAEAKESDYVDLVNPSLFRVDPQYGDRPKYTHTVRRRLTDFVKKGYVKRTVRGVYTLTPSGKQRLKQYQ